ncbi:MULTISPECIES: thiamine pyrophosphate-dependent enzyme [unclassified Burkholderia]|uniref:thiamine pyrophosphate-dependent enzyme n=1 Tax=unclassified Burkholderia TaxID=2613784 RepID=UPI0014205F7A|nr:MULTISPECIES: thiamine pyrophosphate-dependent enzyme [unclassified Burkholderia]NIE83991.1 pyruvate decarboxylase [Burkholderia sp. Tr-860]NIF62629.1 pyruvate decarboxylase [Burkholderia sp. Cy-647]NIF98344.1 pyruvate decarboxylase [Burkholderia sp. Ax-1720]
MSPGSTNTSSHALLSTFVRNGIDRVFLVPGESYLGILDALGDFPELDVVTCRHEGGAAFMACADARLTGRPGVVMVSRGPGATNAAIGVHTAQQDAVPLVLVVGQVPKADLRKEGFQEIDYQKMFGSMAKWVVEVTDPNQLEAAAFKAIRIAASGTPGPVVLVVPEDVQQQPVELHGWQAVSHARTVPEAASVERIRTLLAGAERPLIIAGGAMASDAGREALSALAHAYDIPVAVSFRHHDIFPNRDSLYVGDLGLVNPADQIEAFQGSDLIFALGTRLGDITSQGYTFPCHPAPRQTLIHCWPDDHIVGLNTQPDLGVVCDPVALAEALIREPGSHADRRAWAGKLRSIFERYAAWPEHEVSDGVPFSEVVRSLAAQAPADIAICLDTGMFAAPVYRHFPFTAPQILMASQCGAMGYGTSAAIATQLRRPGRKTVCLVGDGGFLMTGPEMIAAVERNLPILFILSNNHCYGSIRLHQHRKYPGRHVGTSLFNPDFLALARGFGAAAERVTRIDEVDEAIARGLASEGTYLIEVATSLDAILRP